MSCPSLISGVPTVVDLLIIKRNGDLYPSIPTLGILRICALLNRLGKMLYSLFIFLKFDTF